MKCAQTCHTSAIAFPLPPTHAAPHPRGPAHTSRAPPHPRPQDSAARSAEGRNTPANQASLRGRVPTRGSGPLRQKRPACRPFSSADAADSRGRAVFAGLQPTTGTAASAASPSRAGRSTSPHPPGLTRSSLARGPGGQGCFPRGLEAREGRARRRRRGCTCAEEGGSGAARCVASRKLEFSSW